MARHGQCFREITLSYISLRYSTMNPHRGSRPNESSKTPAPSLRMPFQLLLRLVRAADSQLHQVVHEGLQANVVRENRLSSLRDAAVAA